MPCHRCGARQTDPVRGASPWRRGVRRGEQVLVCPDCQRGRDWTADLARCAACGSPRLVRMLGRTSCKDCGAEGEGVEPGTAPAGDSPDSRPEGRDGTAPDVSAPGAPGDVLSSSPDGDRERLAAEVAAALERWRRA